MATRRKENTFKSQRELKVKTNKLPKARENAGDKFVICFSVASNWRREWREFSNPVTKRSKKTNKPSDYILHSIGNSSILRAFCRNKHLNRGSIFPPSPQICFFASRPGT